MRLTKSTITKLELPAGMKESTFYDETLSGFGIRLRASGKKTWVAVYRFGSRTRRVTIGDATTVLPDEARAHAREILAKADLGRDTQAERTDERQREDITLDSVIAFYIEEYVAPRQKPRTQLETKRHLLVHWASLHDCPIARVAHRDIANELSRIVKDHGPIAANRARSALSGLFVWAMHQGISEHNPVAATAPPAPERPRTRILSNGELRTIWRHTNEEGDYLTILRLLLLTGQRRQEVGAMAWSELDFEKALWSIPPERTKNHLAHDVPLSDQALIIVKSVSHQGNRDLMFGRGGGPFSGWSKSKERLDRRIAQDRVEADVGSLVQQNAALPRWVVHDIRRTMVTGMAELGIQPHVIESIVNHVSGHKAGVAGIYNRATYADEKRRALQEWANHIYKIAT